jgi:hypothetical protein
MKIKNNTYREILSIHGKIINRIIVKNKYNVKYLMLLKLNQHCQILGKLM